MCFAMKMYQQTSGTITNILKTGVVTNVDRQSTWTTHDDNSAAAVQNWKNAVLFPKSSAAAVANRPADFHSAHPETDNLSPCVGESDNFNKQKLI